MRENEELNEGKEELEGFDHRKQERRASTMIPEVDSSFVYMPVLKL